MMRKIKAHPLRSDIRSRLPDMVAENDTQSGMGKMGGCMIAHYVKSSLGINLGGDRRAFDQCFFSPCRNESNVYVIVFNLVHRDDLGGQESDALEGIEVLREQNSKLQKELKKIKSEMFSGKSGSNSIGTEQKIGSITLVTHDFGKTDRDLMAGWIEQQKKRAGAIVAVGVGNVNGKKTYIASASNQAVKKHKVDIGVMSKDLLAKFGGRGGGKPSFAQGSLGVETKVEELFAAVHSFFEKRAK